MVENWLSGHQKSEKWLWLHRWCNFCRSDIEKVAVAAARCVFCTFWRVQEARAPNNLGAIWWQFGRILGSGGAEVPRLREQQGYRCRYRLSQVQDDAGTMQGTGTGRCKVQVQDDAGYRCRYMARAKAKAMAKAKAIAATLSRSLDQR